MTERYALDQSEPWGQLLTHLDFAPDRFSLVVLMVPDANGGEICRQALEGWLRLRGRSMESWDERDRAGFHETAARLGSWRPGGETGVLWISGFLGDNEVARREWTWVARRLNEFRDLWRERVPRPVILAGYEWLGALLSEEAPDLWSIRALAVTVMPAPGPRLARPASRCLPFVEAPATEPEEDYQNACTLLGGPGPWPHEAAAQLLQRAGRGWLVRANWARAIEALEQAGHQFELAGSTVAAWNHLLRAVGFLAAHQRQDAKAALQRYRALDPSEVAGGRAAVVEAWLAFEEGLDQEAESWAAEALRAAEATGDLRLRLEALDVSGTCAIESGRLERGLVDYQTALEIAGRLGDPREEALLLGKVERALVQMGRMEQAQELREGRLRPLLERIGFAPN